MGRFQRGFTVIDVLTTVAIVTVLASIAYPSYVAQMRKTHRAEAATTLATLAQAQERFYARFRTYSSNVVGDEDCEGQGCGLGWPSELTDNEYYKLSAEGDGSSYTLSAFAHGSQLDDTDCRVMQIDDDGIKSAKNEGGGDSTEVCW